MTLLYKPNYCNIQKHSIRNILQFYLHNLVLYNDIVAIIIIVVITFMISFDMKFCYRPSLLYGAFKYYNGPYRYLLDTK